jgi:hypothetical protein
MMGADLNKNTNASLPSCDRLATDDGKRDAEKAARNKKLEDIERQLYRLINEVRQLKTT